jgi:hypothetical protein
MNKLVNGPSQRTCLAALRSSSLALEDTMKTDLENLTSSQLDTGCFPQAARRDVSLGPDKPLTISSHPEKGLTLIARQAAVAETELCSAATYEINVIEREQLKALPIHKYVFVRSSEFCNQDTHCRGYLAFGLMSFCSHSGCPKAAIRWDIEGGQTILRLFSVTHIKAMDEVTIRYANVEDYQGASTWAN